jgi:hypothetical protein
MPARVAVSWSNSSNNESDGVKLTTPGAAVLPFAARAHVAVLPNFAMNRVLGPFPLLFKGSMRCGMQFAVKDWSQKLL